MRPKSSRATGGLFGRPDGADIPPPIPPPPVAIMEWMMVACTLLILVSSSGVTAADGILANTTTTGSKQNGSLADGWNSLLPPPSNHSACPPTCFCDLDSSLVSCAGVEDDTVDVVWLDRDNQSVAASAPLLRVPADVWRLVAANGVERLDVRDLIVQQLNKSLLNGTERLNELSLVRCGLLDIGTNTFTDHDNLERLDLSQNQLAILSKVITFETCTNQPASQPPFFHTVLVIWPTWPTVKSLVRHTLVWSLLFVLFFSFSLFLHVPSFGALIE